MVAASGPTALAKKAQGGSRGDRLIGTEGKDVLRGNGGNDRIDGRGGADRLFGGPGNDVIIAGDGDTVDAGPGKDRITMTVAAMGFRLNCGSGRDKLTLRAPRELSKRALLKRVKRCESRKLTRTAEPLPPAPPTAPVPPPATVTPPLVVPAPTVETPPETTLLSTTTGATSTFSFSAGVTGSTFQCRLDGPSGNGAFGACTSPVTYTGLAPGSYTFQVRAVSASGVVDPTPATRAFTVEAPIAAAPVIVQPAEGAWVVSSTFTLSGTAAAGTAVTVREGTTVRGSDTTSLTGQWSVQIVSASEGSHSYTATADNSPASAPRTIIVDTTAPDTTITTGPTGTITDASPSLTFTAENGASFECRLDGPADDGTYQSCTSPKDYTALADGIYTFRVRATDTAGNTDTTPAARTFTVDTTAPDTTIEAGPTGTITDASPSFSFSSETGASFECRLDGPAGDGIYETCTSPKAYTELPDGTYTFNVRATDSAGNTDTTAATRSFTVARRVNVVPEAIWDAPVDPVVGQPTTFDGCSSKGDAPLKYEWSWGFSSTEIWATTCSATYTFPDPGQKSVSLRVIDADGETSIVTREFDVAPEPDTGPPDTIINSAPSATETRSWASFTFSASKPAAWFRCRVDRTAWVHCSSAKSYARLANGAHTFYVAAVDAAGNIDQTPATFTWTIDAPPPTGQGCMEDASACGFPDIETTGVTPGTELTPVEGSITLSTPGEVYEDKLVTGSIIVEAPNVTIRNVKLVATDPFYGIRAFGWVNNVTGLTLDHVEIDLNGNYDAKGVAFDGYTARNVFFHNGSDCAHMGADVTLQDSLCVIGPDVNRDGWPDDRTFCSGTEHFDGFQSDGGRNITIRHNTIRNPCDQTAAILMSTNTEPISNVIIQDNLMAGGAFTLYCNAGGQVANQAVTGNRFAKTYFEMGGMFGPHIGCNTADVFQANVWDETGDAVGL
jgi:hypothetical protein